MGDQTLTEHGKMRPFIHAPNEIRTLDSIVHCGLSRSFVLTSYGLPFARPVLSPRHVLRSLLQLHPTTRPHRPDLEASCIHRHSNFFKNSLQFLCIRNCLFRPKNSHFRGFLVSLYHVTARDFNL